MTATLSIGLIHGWATEPAIWDTVRATLESHGHDVIVYTMPGYGPRNHENGNVTFDDLVNDATDKLKPCDLWVGWSLGAMIALASAATKSTTCRGLFLVCPTAKFCCNDEKAVALNQLRVAIESDSEKAVARFRRSMPSVKNRRPIGKRLQQLHSSGPHSSAPTLLAGLEILSATDLSGEVNKIDFPVGIVSGNEDTIIPCASGKELHRLIPNSTHTTLPCGHVPFLECPQRFMELLFEFAKTINDTAADPKSV